jgi:hypothetical protein
MKKLFNRILVPVHFNRDTPLVLLKAIQVANEFDCDIHLLHVQEPWAGLPFGNSSKSTGILTRSQAQAESRLEKLKAWCRGQLKDGLLISSVFLRGNWQNLVKDIIIAEHIDLVVIPRLRDGFFKSLLQKININRLVQQTQCPVLTITRKLDASHIINIVVPVIDYLPIRKLTMATFLVKKFNGVIHLTGQRDMDTLTGEKKDGRCLTMAYQFIMEYANVKVYCTPGKGNTVGADALAYAKTVQADLIVVNPGRESVISGIFSKWLGKNIYRASNIPVLTIAPAQ